MQGTSRVSCNVPPITHRKSRKWPWANAHLNYIAQHERDASYLFMYSDGSEIWDNGTSRTGYGVVGYSSCRTVFKQKGAMAAGTKCFDGEMMGLQVASEGVRRVFEDPDVTNRPTHVIFFADDISSIERMMQPNPRLGRNYVEEFQNNVDTLLDENRSLEVVVRWSPAHCGIRGNDRADQLAKAGALGC
jgi:ribonuclease HI